MGKERNKRANSPKQDPSIPPYTLSSLAQQPKYQSTVLGTKKKDGKGTDRKRKTFYYAAPIFNCRISEKLVAIRDHDIVSQVDLFRSKGAKDEFIYIDKLIKTRVSRVAYRRLKNSILQPGDTLVIESLRRIATHMDSLKAELEFFLENDIRLRVLDMPILSKPASRANPNENDYLIEFLIAFLDSLSLDASTVRNRSKESQIKWESIANDMKAGFLTIEDVVEETGMSKSSIYRYIAQCRNLDELGEGIDELLSGDEKLLDCVVSAGEQDTDSNNEEDPK